MNTRLEMALSLIYEKQIRVQSELASENFQMATYGIGGDIGLHFDTYGKPDQPHEAFIDFETGSCIITLFVLPTSL